MVKTISFYNLRLRKKQRVPLSKTKRVVLKNRAVALKATVNGMKLFRIIKGAPHGRRK